jgi:hypothetical protein
MKEQLITFETAKLAKEKEFDCEVSCSIATTISCKTEIKQYSKSLSEFDFNNFGKNSTVKFYSRPTQTLLQKWLREIHNIKVFVTTHTEVNAKYSYTVLYPPTKGWSLSRDKFSRYINTKGNLTDESYEKVLEEGLQEGLKLIK